MPNQPTKKRHHTVPKMHLKHFAGSDPQGQIWTYDSENGQMWSATPDNTAVISHFYSVERDDGTMDTTIEDYLATIEDAATSPYERLLAGEIPKAPDSRADFARFLAYMYLRTTAMRRKGGELYGRLVQVMAYAYGSHPGAFATMVSDLEKETGRTFSPEMRDQMRKSLLDPTDYVFQVSGEHTLETLGAADKLMELFYQMKWSLVRPLNGYFITSDNPIVRQVDPTSVHPIRGDRGFMNRTVEVTFPLSPKIQLLMTWQRDAPEIGFVRRDRVDMINEAMAAHSDRYLFAHLRDRRVRRLASRFRASKPGWKTIGFGPDKFAKIEVVRRSARR
jgi:hypothetical protein